MPNTTLPSLLISIAATFAAPLCWAQGFGSGVDPVRQGISLATDWLNAAANQGSPQANRPMLGQLLPMDIDNYKLFVRNAYAEPPIDLGSPALSAFLQMGGKVDESVKDVCFFLYNEKSREDLNSQFIAPHDSRFPANIAPYLFLAAHEYGHCLDFRSRKQNLRPPLLGEAYADTFAILLLRQAKIPAEEIMSIVASRQNGGSTHSTMKWCKRAILAPIANFAYSIEDLARLADNLIEANF